VTVAVRHRARVLVVDERVPRPDRDGGSLRMANLLRVLAEMGNDVSFAPQFPDAADPRRLRGADGARLVWDEPPAAHLRHAGPRYDVVILSRPEVAVELVPEVRRFAPRALLVYDTVDLSFVREFRLAKLRRSRFLLDVALRRRRQELSLVRAADRTLVVSEREKEVLEEASPGASVHVVSNVHESPGGERSFDERSGALFVGNFGHEPNLDAVGYLVEDVWPRVRELRPGLDLHVVGPKAPDWLLALDAEDIHVAGWVDEATLAEYLQRCRLSVAPLRVGAGVKGKVLESLGHGLPVVGSAVAFEGVPVTNGREVLFADAPDAFAHSVVRLHDDERLWAALSARGADVVAAHFSFAAARAALSAALAPLEVVR
jgi:glycosyltransferase involved in cell wall biosynthesis